MKESLCVCVCVCERESERSYCLICKCFVNLQHSVVCRRHTPESTSRPWSTRLVGSRTAQRRILREDRKVVCSAQNKNTSCRYISSRCGSGPGKAKIVKKFFLPRSAVNPIKLEIQITENDFSVISLTVSSKEKYLPVLWAHELSIVKLQKNVVSFIGLGANLLTFAFYNFQPHMVPDL